MNSIFCCCFGELVHLIIQFIQGLVQLRREKFSVWAQPIHNKTMFHRHQHRSRHKGGRKGRHYMNWKYLEKYWKWSNIQKIHDVHVKILHDFRWKFASGENQSAECLRGFIVFPFDSIHISQATAMRLSYNKIHSDGTDFGKLLKPQNFVIWKCTFTWSKIPPRIPLVDSLRMNRSGIAIVQEMYNGGHFITIYHFATVKSTFMLNQYEIAQV